MIPAASRTPRLASVSGSFLRTVTSHSPTSAPGLHSCLTFIRHQFRPPRSVYYNPTKTDTVVAHASVTFCNTRHRLSPVLARNMPLASSSLASAPPHTKKSKKPRAPGTQKPREKLLTFKRHTADFPTTKPQPLCSAITINTS